MKATTLLLHARRGIQLLAEELLEAGGARDARVVALIDAVSVLVALETQLLRAGIVPDEARLHEMAHDQARVALFRIATSPHAGPEFRRSLRTLAHVFGARSVDLAAALERKLGAGPQLEEIGDELSRLADAISSSPGRDDGGMLAKALTRCEHALEHCV